MGLGKYLKVFMSYFVDVADMGTMSYIKETSEAHTAQSSENEYSVQEIIMYCAICSNSKEVALLMMCYEKFFFPPTRMVERRTIPLDIRALLIGTG